MRILACFILSFCLFGHDLKGQTPTVTLSADIHSRYEARFRMDVQKAFALASDILGSPEFADSIKRLEFKYRNRCNGCKPMRIYLGSKKISGKAVLDSLYKHSNTMLKLILDSGTCKGSLGETCPINNNPLHETTSYYNALQCDMPELPFSYRLAVNICHEYMHYIGFCHPSLIDKAPDKDHPAPEAYRNDVAYRVGWIAYYITLRRNRNAQHL